MENPIKMDDLGAPLFSETSTWGVFLFTLKSQVTDECGNSKS